jgi:hypothetical protein
MGELMDDEAFGEPRSFFTIERGIPVLTSDGVEIGRVKRVLIVHAKNIFDGIVITGRDGDRFVDAPAVGVSPGRGSAAASSASIESRTARS